MSINKKELIEVFEPYVEKFPKLEKPLDHLATKPKRKIPDVVAFCIMNGLFHESSFSLLADEDIRKLFSDVIKSGKSDLNALAHGIDKSLAMQYGSENSPAATPRQKR